MLTMFSPAPGLALAALAMLSGLLLHVCCTDLQARRIGNRACLAVALLALPFWLGVGDAGLQPLLILSLSIPPLLLIWRFGALGGGDVKLLAACMLWMTDKTLPVLLVVTTFSGAVLGVAILCARPYRRPNGPFGVAIALGMVAALMPDILQLTRAAFLSWQFAAR